MPSALERLQPDDAGGGLLGAADDVAELLAAGGVEDADHVGAVVHRDVRLVVDRGLDVLVVRSLSSPLIAKVEMPYSSTSAAATSSCVDSGLEAQMTTSAPPACSVRIRFAVSVVTCRQAETR